MRLIERANYQPMAWKNGAGCTTQIAIHPADATVGNFDWRISTAVVMTDGAFSNFPGVERTLVVLEGAGIDLAITGDQAQSLTRLSAPFTFAADAGAHAALIDGPIVDLNVMTRRDHFSHRVRKLSGSTGWLPVCGTAVVYAHGTGFDIDDNVQFNRIELGNTGIFEAGCKGLNIVAEGAGDYCLVALTGI